MTTPAPAFFYRVPAKREDNGIVPDLSEAQGAVEYVAEYDASAEEFVIRTDKAARGLTHRKVERPEHGLHAHPDSTKALAAPVPKGDPHPRFDDETQTVWERVHAAELAALEAGKDPSKAATAKDKKVLDDARARGERPRGATP